MALGFRGPWGEGGTLGRRLFRRLDGCVLFYGCCFRRTGGFLQGTLGPGPGTQERRREPSAEKETRTGGRGDSFDDLDQKNNNNNKK